MKEGGDGEGGDREGGDGEGRGGGGGGGGERGRLEGFQASPLPPPRRPIALYR
jgi:hypothetical protein